jgi:hypothetical protein
MRPQLLACLRFGNQGTPHGEQQFLVSRDNLLETRLENFGGNA